MPGGWSARSRRRITCARSLRGSAAWLAAERDPECRGTPVRPHDRPVPEIDSVAIYAQDVTARNRDQARLEKEAFYDGLTGLPNRALLIDRIARLQAMVRRDADHRYAVLFLDLDRFKPVNDSVGHRAGDRLLQLVTERLLEAVRDVDTVARLGGDEFVVVLETTADVSDAAIAAWRIRSSLREAFTIEGQEVFIDTSIGIVLSST